MNRVVLELSGPAPRALVSTMPAVDIAAMRRDRFFVPTAAYLLACIALGGAGDGGVAPNAVLQMAAVGLLLWLAFERGAVMLRAQHAALAFGMALVVLILLQLVPLPPAVWSALPGRAAVRQGYALLALDAPWLPWTLAPERTVQMLLALLPPLAVLSLALRLGREARVGVMLLVAAAALGSVALDVVQRLGVPALYAGSAMRRPMGLFASAADHVTLLSVALTCLAPAAAREAGRMRHDARARRRLAMLGAAALLLVAGLAGGGGGVLAAPALAIGAGAALAPRWRGWRLAAIAALAGGAGAAVTVPTWTTHPAGMPGGSVWAAAWAFLPWGAGAGSFAVLSGTFTSIEALGRVAPAHAGSDVAEWLLEGGVPAAVLLTLFVGWWARQAAAAWRARGAGAATRQAGAAIVALVLLASVAGAPLRTAALAAVAALGVALLADHPAPPPGRRRGR